MKRFRGAASPLVSPLKLLTSRRRRPDTGTENPGVGSSILPLSTIFFLDGHFWSLASAHGTSSISLGRHCFVKNDSSGLYRRRIMVVSLHPANRPGATWCHLARSPCPHRLIVQATGCSPSWTDRESRPRIPGASWPGTQPAPRHGLPSSPQGTCPASLTESRNPATSEACRAWACPGWRTFCDPIKRLRSWPLQD